MSKLGIAPRNLKRIGTLTLPQQWQAYVRNEFAGQAAARMMISGPSIANLGGDVQ